MSHKHPPMPIEQRAKQFMPFAAVTGLQAALHKKEQEHEAAMEQETVDPDAPDQETQETYYSIE